MTSEPLYSLPNHYFYTEKVRATSGNENFFIHDSGRFAVEIFSETCNSYIQRADENLVKTMINRLFCVWNISNCREDDIQKLTDWCEVNEYKISFLENEVGIVIISHYFFSFGEFGDMIPGMDTWKKYDETDFKSEEFMAKIPCGRPPDDRVYQDICNKYLHSHIDSTNEIITSYEQTLQGEALRHDARVIRFTCYICPIVEQFQEQFQGFVSILEERLKNKFISLKIRYIPYDDINDVVLEFVPYYNMSTADAVNIAEPLFLELLNNLFDLVDNSHNTAYYVKYLLDRWIPEQVTIE